MFLRVCGHAVVWVMTISILIGWICLPLEILEDWFKETILSLVDQDTFIDDFRAAWLGIIGVVLFATWLLGFGFFVCLGYIISLEINEKWRD